MSRADRAALAAALGIVAAVLALAAVAVFFAKGGGWAPTPAEDVRTLTESSGVFCDSYEHGTEVRCVNGATGNEVRVYEDGSGVEYEGAAEVRTYPEDTFRWDCRVMGNRVCGPAARTGQWWPCWGVGHALPGG